MGDFQWPHQQQQEPQGSLLGLLILVALVTGVIVVTVRVCGAAL